MLCELEIEECKGLVCSTSIDSRLIEVVSLSNSSLEIFGCKGMLYSSPAELLQSVTI